MSSAISDRSFARPWSFLLWAFLPLLQLSEAAPQCSDNATNAGCFTAAVYEHVRIGDKLNLNSAASVHQYIYSNLNVLRQVAQLATIKGAKILVTPEYAIYPLLSSRAIAVNGFMVSLPAIGTSVCNSSDQRYLPMVNPYAPPIHVPHQLAEPPLSNDKMLEQIACIAQQSQLYLAADVPELELCAGQSGCSDDGYNLYNTLVVFNANGTLISKYRKYHLFSEPIMNHPPKPEVITFDSEFGRFGLIVCFDLMFRQPLADLIREQNIDHLLFSTDWFDELPLLTGLAFHAGTAHRSHVNMLSANLRNLAKGTFGSAIFSANEGVRIQTEFNNHNRLLLASLPIPCHRDLLQSKHRKSNSSGSFESSADAIIQEFEAQDDQTSLGSAPEERDEVVIVDNVDNGWTDASESSGQSSNQRCTYVEPVSIGERVYRQNSYLLGENFRFEQYQYLENQLSEYKHRRIETTSGRISRVCDGSVCCSLSWRMNPRFNFASDDYYLVALNRLRTKTTYPWYEQACAMVSYSHATNKFKLSASTHFDHIRLTGWFDSDAAFPSLLSSRLQVVPSRSWQFVQANTTSQISLTDLHQPLAFASIYTRVYSRDRV
jgi:predicted amidohydrolase